MKPTKADLATRTTISVMLDDLDEFLQHYSWCTPRQGISECECGLMKKISQWRDVAKLYTEKSIGTTLVLKAAIDRRMQQGPL